MDVNIADKKWSSWGVASTLCQVSTDLCILQGNTCCIRSPKKGCHYSGQEVTALYQIQELFYTFPTMTMLILFLIIWFNLIRYACITIFTGWNVYFSYLLSSGLCVNRSLLSGTRGPRRRVIGRWVDQGILYIVQ